jgi:hypothetical protein
MERTKLPGDYKTSQDGKIKWVNKGGTFRMIIDGRRKIIKPNEKFMARPDQIPETFRDVLKPEQPLPGEPELQIADAGYRVRRRGNSELFDIIDGRKKVVNQKALTEEEAKALLEKLVE